jgi:twitching motility protein PilU
VGRTLQIQDLLMVMVERDASDLYLKVPNPPVYRVHGQSEPADLPALTPEDTHRLALQVMRPKDVDTFEQRCQADLSFVIDGVGQFRANIYTQRGTTALVFRKINSIVPAFEDLALPEVLKTLAMEKRGLVLVTGATGSGKSTTLAAMIDYRNRNTTGHIVTLEDPIEFMHLDRGCLLSQREVGLDVMNFHDGLKAALRQAPDVLLIGEMRDEETVSAAMHFAETGHLVLSTLHSTNASQTLERVMQFFPADRHPEVCSMLGHSLRGIISQRLVRRLDGGRVAAIEILINTPRVAELLKRGAMDELKSAIAAGDRDGMQTFGQALYHLYQDGLISEEEALTAADSANDLKLRMRGFVSVGR